MASQARVSAYLKDNKDWPDLSLYSAKKQSPPFASSACPEIKWRLSVVRGAGSQCPAGHACPTCAKCLEFSLELVGGGEVKELEPELFVSASGAQGYQLVTASDCVRDFPYKLCLSSDGEPFPSDTKVVACVTFNRPSSQLPSVVQSGVSRLLTDPKHADFEILAGEERIPIHKAIFASFSPVFARMFERDMEEKAQGFVVAEDASAKAIAGLRDFLYAGRLAAVRADLATFLDLGEKYQIRELKDFCCAELRKTLVPANLCDRAVLAEVYGMEELFEDCRRMIKSKDSASLSVTKEDWDRLVRDHKAISERLWNLTYSN